MTGALLYKINQSTPRKSLGKRYQNTAVQLYLQFGAVSLGEKLRHQTEICASLTQHFIEIQRFYTKEKKELSHAVKAWFHTSNFVGDSWAGCSKVD
jgi:hypothetical protein